MMHTTKKKHPDQVMLFVTESETLDAKTTLGRNHGNHTNHIDAYIPPAA